ncbi:Noggin-2 [Dissostichus eleginoides]|uniref:Noggin-2 n=1 Tax=Dissostichus eleginoides TaxID=100907 RepID=A0AAD9F588_DISEL|nr:Noggin-2 [Dissostichus eleginoides]
MPELFDCGVCFCWISVLLHGTSNVSTQNQNLTIVKIKEDTIWDSPFLHLRERLQSYSQPIRPYTLLTSAEDYHHMPRPRHLRPSCLLRLLGSSFDLIWMSIEQPSEASRSQLLGNFSLPGEFPTTTRKKLNPSASPELSEAAANSRQKLVKYAADLDLGSFPKHVASSVRDWLVRSATCGLIYQWVDLGPAFWPRWVRQTDCQKSGGEPSCSFPAGMECVRAETALIKILAWHCLENKKGDDGWRRLEADGSDGGTEMRTGEARKKCLWRQMPYPVVTACTCSCK